MATSSSIPRTWGCLHPSSSSTTHTKNSAPFPTISLSFSPSTLCGSNKIRLNHSSNTIFRTQAKFDKFQGQEVDNQNSVQTQQDDDDDGDGDGDEVQVEDDSCLPSDLEGAVRQASEATATFVSSGGMRAIVRIWSDNQLLVSYHGTITRETSISRLVELLIPQLQFLDDEGAQAELWELSRIFVDSLIEETGCQKVKAIYPDAGAAALLKYRWKDAVFGFASLSDRKPVQSEDEIVVMVVPDYQMLEYVERIAASLSDDPPRPLIMWNPRLVSEDVGVGFNVRKLRRYFLRTFTTVYSLRPLPLGATFRCYPGMWKVFYDDKDRPNRYILAKEMISRPDAEDLEVIFGEEEEKSDNSPSLLVKAAGIFSSINRFMRVISK